MGTSFKFAKQTLDLQPLSRWFGPQSICLVIVSQNTSLDFGTVLSCLESRAFAIPSQFFKRDLQERSNICELKEKKKYHSRPKFCILFYGEHLNPSWHLTGLLAFLQPAVQAEITVCCQFQRDAMRPVLFHACLTAFTMWKTFRWRKLERVKIGVISVEMTGHQLTMFTLGFGTASVLRFRPW